MGVFQAQALEVNTRPIHNFPPAQDFKFYLSKQSASILYSYLFLSFIQCLFFVSLALTLSLSLSVSLSFPYISC